MHNSKKILGVTLTLQVCAAVVEAFGNKQIISSNTESILAIGYYKKGTDKEIKILLFLDPSNGLIKNAHPEIPDE